MSLAFTIFVLLISVHMLGFSHRENQKLLWLFWVFLVLLNSFTLTAKLMDMYNDIHTSQERLEQLLIQLNNEDNSTNTKEQ